MISYKIDRISEDIRREITNILREIKDPRVNNKIITVLKVSLTNDMSYAKIYISSMDGLNGTLVTVEGLKSAKGFIKKKLASRLKIKKMPELEFIPDNYLENTINMFKKLKN